MNGVISSLSGTTTHSALAGARGPAQASASLLREAHRYQSLERATNWIKPMFALAPLLGEGSLYGTTLGILVDALGQQRASPPRRSERKNVGHELSPVGRTHASVSSSETRTTHSGTFGAAPGFGGRTNAGSSAPSAEKCSGIIGSSSGCTQNGAPFLVETCVTVVPASAVSTSTESASVANIVGSVSTTTMAMLREQLAQRAATRLTSMRTSGDHLAVARALMGQWGNSMEGVGASEELLLEASAVQLDGALASAPSGDSLPLSSNHPSPIAPQSEGEALTHGSSSVPALAPAGTSGSVAPLPNPTFVPSATLTEEIFFRSGSTLEAGSFPAANRPGAQIGEPGASLKVVGGPDFPTVEDLDLEATEAFSAKMKRVLDEEARRYGINV